MSTLAAGWQRLVVGNWIGAGLTALAALLTTGLLGGVLALVAKPADFGVDNTLTLATVFATSAFGANLTVSITGGGQGAGGHAAVGVFPLTITVVTLVVAVVIFRRVIARYESPYAALGDAARAAVLFGIGLMVPALVFRTDNDKMGRGWAAELTRDRQNVAADLGASAVEALFFGIFIMLVVLAGLVFCRRRWWTGRVAELHEWVAAPLAGIATTFVLLPIAGAIGLAAILMFGEDTTSQFTSADGWRPVAAVYVGLLANGGMWLIGLGSGAAIGVDGRATGSSPGRGSEWQHLWGDLTDQEPGLWIAPVVMIAVLLLSGYAVARRTTGRDRVVGNLLVWAGSLIVAVPLLVRLSGLHARAELTANGVRFDRLDLTGYLGLHGVQTTVLLVAFALLCGVFIAWRFGALDRGDLRRQFSPGGDVSPSGPPSATPPPPSWPSPDAEWDRLD